MIALRFLLTLPYTVLGIAWGVAWGGSLRLRRGLIIECGGMRGGFARGGLQIGSAWLCNTLNDDGRLRHESVHATQWAIFGPFFPLLYWVAELIWPMERNPFEQWAGLQDGGYR